MFNAIAGPFSEKPTPIMFEVTVGGPATGACVTFMVTLQLALSAMFATTAAAYVPGDVKKGEELMLPLKLGGYVTNAS